MFGHSKPIVLVSKCLGFGRCRYDGTTKTYDFVKLLKRFVRFIPICPEVEIGLGVPREAIRVIMSKNRLRLIQPATGLDLTRKMSAFSRRFLASVGPVDGCILKSRSPSCGINDARVYPSVEADSTKTHGPGFFGRAILEALAGHPVEDEGRLKNRHIREHFLTRLFTAARFRTASRGLKIGNLVKFHTQHKLLLMASNQNEMRVLDKIVVNHRRRSAVDVFARYREHLMPALSKPPRFTSDVNVLMRAFAYFKDRLGPREKGRFLNRVGEYRNAKLPLSVLLTIVNSWIARCRKCVSGRGEQNLESQIYFKPYPQGLFDTAD